ncbi:hypothetical protein Droror1_Dr00018575 [Drosera rotundifolia]
MERANRKPESLSLPLSMTQNSDGSGRRVLTTPAIFPLDVVPLSILLESTVSLAARICGPRPDPFVNKLNIKDTIRLIEIIHLLLIELRASNPIADEGTQRTQLGLSELNFVLQKLEFLVDDCSRRDSRVWVLMNGQLVADRIRVLVREIGVAIEVIGWGALGEEGRYWVEFVIGKARSLRFEVEVEDQYVIEIVDSAMRPFEAGLEPGMGDVRMVLEGLGVRKWSDCYREVRFLEGEIRSGISSNSEAELCNGLLGLMIYSWCVLFDCVDCVIDRRVDDGKWIGNGIGRLKPVDLRCPISLEIMVDPVTISTGHTYERKSIVKWFKGGNPTCPKTGERIVSFELVPNLALKRLIAQYCVENGIDLPKLKSGRRDNIVGTTSAAGKAAEGALRLAADFLVMKLAMGQCHEKNKAAYEIRLLSKRNIFHRACLVESGAIPCLLKLTLSSDPLAQENAVAALLNLSKHPQARLAIIENGGLPLILSVLQGGLRMEARQHSAAVLFYLSSVEEYRRLIGSTQGLIPALVDVIRDGNDRGKRNALVAIYSLLLDPRSHHRVLNTESVPLLASFLSSLDKEELMIESLAVLSALGERPVGAMAILRTEALGSVVGILCSSCDSRFAKEHCVSLLLAICTIGGREVIQVLSKDQFLMGSLYTVMTEGTSRARKKASALIRMFHAFSEESPSPSVPLRLPREPFIRVGSSIFI